MAAPPPTLSRRVFDRFDADKSGSISKQEFKALCYHSGYCLSETELEHAVKRIDADGSGAITFDEFQKWWRNDDRFGKLQLSEAEQAALDGAATYFEYFDKDHSGSIDRAEFAELHKNLVAHKYTSHPADKCLEDLDKASDGKIQYKDFVDWLIREGKLSVANLD